MAVLPAVLQNIKKKKEGKRQVLHLVVQWRPLLWDFIRLEPLISAAGTPLFDVKYWPIGLTDADCLPASNGI